MYFRKFIKDKVWQIGLLLFALTTIEIFLWIYPYGTFLQLYIPIVIIGVYLFSILLEYGRKKAYFQTVKRLLEELDEKYLIAEVMPTPPFEEGKLWQEILHQTDKYMIENVHQYQYLQEDYKEYIEMWIHEIKIPIATSKLIVENHKNAVTKSIGEELDKVENYVEQALYYARSNTVDKDYFIKKCCLQDLVKECIQKNQKALITGNIAVHTHDLDVYVHTDSKWILFILHQIIQNSVQYRKPEGNAWIEIYAKTGKENTTLYIQDNGRGMEKGEVARVFEKGFTGTNGRMLNKKSTGIGLYLCKKLCNKLGIGIEFSSTYQEGSEVRIVFPNNSFIAM